MEKKLFAVLFLMLLLVPLAAATYYRETTPSVYTPYNSQEIIDDTQTSGCNVEMNDCSTCLREYKFDCAFYYYKEPDQCKTIAKDSMELTSCVQMIFEASVKDPKRIEETCNVIGDPKGRYDSVNGCLANLVPIYGEEADLGLCAEITPDDMRDSCYGQWAVNHKQPKACSHIELAIETQINCCLDSQYNFDSYYMVTRQDIMDAYMKLHGEEVNGCKKLLGIKPPAENAECEKLNCDCLDPCNKLAADPDKQAKCAKDCAYDYYVCYAKAEQELTEQKLQMYWGQTISGTFSRKHCPHSLLPDSAGDTLSTKITGTVTDFEGHPLVYMPVLINTSEGNIFSGITDDKGAYSIDVQGLKWAQGTEQIEAMLVAYMVYTRDGKQYFSVVKSNGPYWYARKFKITGPADLKVDLVWGGAQQADDTFNAIAANLQPVSLIYFHTSEAAEFAIKALKIQPNFVEVWPFLGGGNGAYYSPDKPEIVIHSNDAGTGSTNRPRNREWHEFAHGDMYTVYGGWPAGRLEPNVSNHDGFLNPNTGDSYLEGFAEYMSLQTAVYLKYVNPAPDIYASFGSLEDNYRPWDNEGRFEELAIASYLWDLTDDHNEPGDDLTLPFQDVWSVLKVNRANFYEYFLAMKQKWPDKVDALDKLAILHGFYLDNVTGNKRWDPYEGYRDKNKDNAYTPGEYYVDYPSNPTNISYDGASRIGVGANYQRVDRHSAGRMPNAYLKVDDKEVRMYTIKVHYDDPKLGLKDYSYDVDLRDGLLYVQPRPDNVKATITIMPNSKDYRAGKTFTITNAELIKKIESSKNGYFAEQRFGLTATGTKLDPPYGLADNAEPKWDYGELAGGSNPAVTPIVTYPNLPKTTKGGGAGGAVGILVAAIVIAVVVAGAILLLRKRKK